jgi:hypothetical protein
MSDTRPSPGNTWSDTRRAGECVLVVSPANEERRQLNAVIREVLKKRGLVGSREAEQTILLSRDLTRLQRAQARSYEVGDIVHSPRKQAHGRLGSFSSA